MTQPKKTPKKSLLSTVGVVIIAVLLILAQQMGLLPGAEEAPTATPAAAVTTAPTEAPAAVAEESLPITEPQAIVNYLAAHDGKLPDNFLTKAEAQSLGWDSSRNYVSDVAPGKSIGGDRFGNYEGLLPTEKGRQYHEADCYYTEGARNAYRLVYSTDGLYFYTEDHYQTFKELYPEN